MEARRALSVIRVLTVLALFSLLTACPCVEVTPEGRVLAMDSVRTALEELPDNATSAEILTVAAEAMDGRQEFEASGTMPEYGMAWGRFPGGATYVVDANGRPGYSSFPVDADLQDIFTAPFPVPAALPDPMLDEIGLPADSSTLTGIPAGPAVLFQVLGPEYANVTEVLSPWLLEAGYSTTVNPQVGGTVEDLQKIDGPAFFYMGTHGIIATLFPSPTAAAPSAYSSAIMTATEPTPEAQAAYAADLADQSLVMVDGLLPGMMRRFYFTSRFVAKYMTLAPNSFVYLDCCSSNHPDAPLLREAFFEAGASLFAGWSMVVNDRACEESTPFLLCRMLGAPAPDGQDLGPPRRPFDYGDAYAELHLRGWDVDQYDVGAELRVDAAPYGGGWLRPSIECLRVDEYPTGASSGQSELIIRGSFGPDPGAGPFHAARKVECGGEELSLVFWSPEEIRATMPIHGPGSAGKVIVTTQGIKSNAVPLTEWWVTLKYRIDAPIGSGSTEFTEFAIDCRLRYDIHGWRETATSDLHFALPEAEDPPTHFATNSFGSFRCGGDKAFYDAESGAFIYKIIYGGTGSLPYLASGSGNGCWGSTRLRYETIGAGQPPTLFIDGAVYAEGYPKTSFVLWADGHISNEEQRRVALNEYSNGTIVISQGETFRFMIGEDGAIEAGESGQLSWQRTLPRFQPTSATPR